MPRFSAACSYDKEPPAKVLVGLRGVARIDAVVISVVLAVGLFVGGVGSRWSPHILPSWSTERRILVFRCASPASLCTIATSNLALMITGYITMALALGGSNVATITYRQEAVPVDLAGRVNSVIRMFIAGAIPLSGLVYAWASRFVGLLFWVPGLAIAALSLTIWAIYTASTRAQCRMSPKGALP